jgi:uncharacterized protein (DUF427 family)
VLIPAFMKPQRIEPQPGQESVWDYPRPPRVEPVTKPIEVIFNGVVIAQTTNAQRILETSHPPVYYIPPADIHMQYLEIAPGGSFCEWKGWATYFSVVVAGQRAEKAAWEYPEPTPGFRAIADHIAFYPSMMDVCSIGGEVVTPQPGGFYGGWITSDIVGPFKGEPGTFGW